MKANNYIKFLHSSNFKPSDPKPSLKVPPLWWSQTKKNYPNYADGRNTLGTSKKCVPVLDALSQGYIIPLPCDLEVFYQDCYNIVKPDDTPAIGEGYYLKHEIDNGIALKIPFETKIVEVGPKPVFRWRDEFDGMHYLVGFHDKKQVGAFHQGRFELFKFMNPWIIQTPEGVSCRFTTPVNRDDLPFQLIEGVVDTDTYYQEVHFPFIWLGGPTEEPTVLKKGTPLCQVIPFVRTDFELEIGVWDDNKRNQVLNNINSHLEDGYRREYWHKKEKKE